MRTGQKLRDANPEAFRNIVARAIAAQGRSFWNADEEKLEKLRELYASTEAKYRTKIVGKIETRLVLNLDR